MSDTKSNPAPEREHRGEREIRDEQDRENARELGAAGSQLSTAPREESAVTLPAMGAIGWARWFWRQLTSMRVALILLFLLSLGAIPGSLIPQNSVDEMKVQAFKDAHTTITPIYEKLQFFDVYSSVWFSAIYILLFVSLIGCIVPRTGQFIGQLRSRPPGAPKRLTRLPVYTTWRTEAEPEQVREAALAMMRSRRYRAHTAGDAVAAEKGYLREAGNLVFHIALIVMLVAFAFGQLFKSEGAKLVVEGDGFSNTLTQYDDFKSGSLFDNNSLAPFSFKLDKFIGTYERSGPQAGTPRTYEAHVTYEKGAYGKPQKAVIEVNKPLVVDGTKVYLNAHGYAPVVSVKDASGKVVYRNAVPLLPIDSNVTSTGAIKVMDGYRDKNGKKTQLGFQAFFVPTFAGDNQGTMFSQFPAADNPRLALNGSYGSLGVDSGLPQNVYQLDKSKMTEFKDSKGNQLKQRLAVGDTMKLPDGAGSITFEGVEEWASFQISEQPASGWALTGAIAAIAGLAGSLFIQRRRIWVRAVRGADGVTVVEMAGLGRSESAKLPEELADLAVTLNAVAPTAPGPDTDPGSDSGSVEESSVEPAEGAEK
ncbi:MULTISPECIES: cytochrome c biogenesis protein ResB [unclassified Streptomyces]|uniref:cytochrome c biogenesis protein ResB n=1 Tax=unclassified Streptomyces TaxID=2593676 RepID=UPI0022515ED0|nr:MULTISPECIES: cytochrome c biogenesis protein ResB [unclassified Streptomyces]MCX4787455.1 cytochrome c biogenesis protein ResB [Streptomyces sp. NBC_01221]WSJ37985.1 cytochrome c biogenesis protein ResB [Streptomyces sp. NBC_01321]WSP55749.1 cytochrome c biogenesis protein ResB [Streptomyces sp. NBC_01241]WSP64386.1 cytochrome c biogenesis protein ResB [Streptomyces sp. NBC_01240]